MNFVNVNGLNIHYLEQGVGEEVVFVHGWPTSSFLWRHQVGPLSQTHRVLAPDLPGFGDSDRPADVRYDLPFFVSFLGKFLDATDVERATLVCHDLGGPIALTFAVRHPERVGRLVILDTTPYPELPPALRMLLRVMAAPLVGDFIVSRTGIALTLRWVGVVGNRAAITSDVVDGYYRPYAQDRAARRILLRILRELDPGEMVETAQGLGQIEAPTLIIWGDKDPTAPVSVARRLHQDIQGSQLVVLENCGHFVPEDKPEEVTRLMLEFLV